MRKLSLLVALCLCGILAAQALAATTVTTSVRDDYFAQSRLTVKKGTTVVWKWVKTDEPHTVTDTKKRFGSKKITKGSYNHTFKKAGKFTVYCKVHPTVMRQKITVK